MEAGIEAYRTWKRERKMKGLYGIERKAERKVNFTRDFYEKIEDLKRCFILWFGL